MTKIFCHQGTELTHISLYKETLDVKGGEERETEIEDKVVEICRLGCSKVCWNNLSPGKV